MWQSSIELHFCFHATPQYIGLIKDEYIDLLCFKNDNILVNDDDHQDLIRVSNLFDLFNLKTKDIATLTHNDFSFQSQMQLQKFNDLYQCFNNKQITKSIPFFFKDNYQNNDYRIFRYDDIQRKIIYGILRRSYALLAEVILQNLLRSSNYDQIGVQMMKKYMGQLLST